MGAQAPPAGWYQDPGGPGLRYWDGARWTEHVRGLVQEPFPQQQAQQAPAPAAAGPAAGWHPDPTTRYELRYWDGAAWTDHVGASNGWRGVDPVAGGGTGAMPVVAASGQTPPYGGPGSGGQPAQQAWGAPPQAASRSRVQYLGLIGAVAVAVSAVLPWIDFPGPGGTASALDTPVAFLFDPASASGGLKLGLLLILLGVAAAVLTFVPGAKAIRRSLGSAVSAASVLFVVQVVRLVSDSGGDIGDAFKVVGFGVYVALVGGILVATGK